MAYEKHTWSCGETVTADLLNHMEDGIEGADPGYECTENVNKTVVFEDSVTTQEGSGLGWATISAVLQKTAVQEVVMNGTTYILPQAESGNELDYGEFENGMPIFNNYPCAIMGTENNATLFTETPGEYSIKISSVETEYDIEATECFKKAVDESFSKIKTVHLTFEDFNYVSSDMTFREVSRLIKDGSVVLAWMKRIESNVPIVDVFPLTYHYGSNSIQGYFYRGGSQDIRAYSFNWNSNSNPSLATS